MGHRPAGRVTALPQLEVLSTRPAADTNQYPGVRRQEWFDTEGRLAAFGGGTATTWWIHWPHLGTFQFSSDGPVIAHPELGARGSDLQESFARTVLPFVLIARDHEALHGSAVAHAHGVSAFCGISGTGKSTLAFALARHGAMHWADDALVLRIEEPVVRAIGLPFPARVDRAVVEALAMNPGESQQVTPGETMPLRRVYFISRDSRLDPNRPSIQSLEGAPAFERLLAHAHPFDLPGPDRRRRMIERLLLVARLVPMYDLRFAPELTSLPRLVDEVGRHLTSS
jgi:hypothetical protein